MKTSLLFLLLTSADSFTPSHLIEKRSYGRHIFVTTRAPEKRKKNGVVLYKHISEEDCTDTHIDTIPTHTQVQGRKEFIQKASLALLTTSILLSSSSSSANEIDTSDDSTIEEKLDKSFEFPIDPRYFLAGGGCASFSHGIATPFDVIKTKIQTFPQDYTGGFLPSTMKMIQEDGIGVLAKGLVPTLIGYGLEGAVKFGVYESLKPTMVQLLHMEDKFIPYLLASIGAGAVASIMLVPMERARIKVVTSEQENVGPLGGVGDLIKEDGLNAVFYGYTTMLLKQVPYTMTKQVSFELFATNLFAIATTSLALPVNDETRLLTTVTSAFCASILACTISQPGDVLLTKTLKDNEGDSPIANAIQVYQDKGFVGFYAGYAARLAHVVSIVTSQLVVYDYLKQLLGLPATGS